jgi:hypothetical protein
MNHGHPSAASAFFNSLLKRPALARYLIEIRLKVRK